MGIAKVQFQKILGDIFEVGNRIELFRTVPDETTEEGGVKITGDSYKYYTIKDGDFLIEDGEVSSKENMMMYLCEELDGHGWAKGFGIYNSSGTTLLYFGKFSNKDAEGNEGIYIDYNDVPIIKKYNKELNEGIHIKMTSKEISNEIET